MVPYSSLSFFVPQLAPFGCDSALGLLLPLPAVNAYKAEVHSHEAMKLRARGIAKQWSALFFPASSPGLGPVGRIKSRKSTCCI